MAVGLQGHLGLRVESSFASGGAVDSWQPINNATLNLAYNNVYSDRVRNTGEQVGGQQANRTVTGSIVFPVSPQGPLQWWRVAVGQTSTPYSIARPLSSLLIQLDLEQEAVQVSGCMVGSLQLSSQAGGELTATVDVEAKDLADVAAGSPSFTASDNPYLHSEAVIKLNGSTDTKVQSWSVTINNNLVTDLFGTGYTRVDIPAGKLAVTGTFTKLFDSSTERDAFLAATVRSFQVTFTRGARSFDVNIAKLRYNSRPHEISGQSDYIMETFEFTGYVDDPATEKSVVVTVTQ